MMSALPPIADIVQHDPDVRFVLKADSCGAAWRIAANFELPELITEAPADLRTIQLLGISGPFAGGFNNSFLSASKHALRSVTFSSALHFSKLGLLISHIAAIKKATASTKKRRPDAELI
jgi:hypothetical protein